MPRRGRKRKKTRTHVVETDERIRGALASQDELKIPRSLVVSEKWDISLNSFNIISVGCIFASVISPIVSFLSSQLRSAEAKWNPKSSN